MARGLGCNILRMAGRGALWRKVESPRLHGGRAASPENRLPFVGKTLKGSRGGGLIV